MVPAAPVPGARSLEALGAREGMNDTQTAQAWPAPRCGRGHPESLSSTHLSPPGQACQSDGLGRAGRLAQGPPPPSLGIRERGLHPFFRTLTSSFCPHAKGPLGNADAPTGLRAERPPVSHEGANATAHTPVTHTPRDPHAPCARGRGGHPGGEGRTDAGQEAGQGLEGPGLPPELYFPAQAAHGRAKPLGESHALPSSRPSTRAPSVVWSVRPRSPLPRAGSGASRGDTPPPRPESRPPLNSGPLLLPGPVPRG